MWHYGGWCCRDRAAGSRTFLPRVKNKPAIRSWLQRWKTSSPKQRRSAGIACTVSGGNTGSYSEKAHFLGQNGGSRGAPPPPDPRHPGSLWVQPGRAVGCRALPGPCLPARGHRARPRRAPNALPGFLLLALAGRCGLAARGVETPWKKQRRDSAALCRPCPLAQQPSVLRGAARRERRQIRGWGTKRFILVCGRACARAAGSVCRALVCLPPQREDTAPGSHPFRAMQTPYVICTQPVSLNFYDLLAD